MQSILGIIVFLSIAWLLSEQKKQRQFKLIISGLGMQFVIAFLLLKISWLKQIFFFLNELVLALVEATSQGTRFVFGYLEEQIVLF